MLNVRGRARIKLVNGADESWVYDGKEFLHDTGPVDFGPYTVRLAAVSSGLSGVSRPPAGSFFRLVVESLETPGTVTAPNVTSLRFLRQTLGNRPVLAHLVNPTDKPILGEPGGGDQVTVGWAHVERLRAAVLEIPYHSDHYERFDPTAAPLPNYGRAYVSAEVQRPFYFVQGDYRAIREDSVETVPTASTSPTLGIFAASVQLVSGVTAATTITLPPNTSGANWPGRRIKFLRDATNAANVTISHAGATVAKLNDNGTWQEVMWTGGTSGAWVASGTGLLKPP